MKTSKHAFTMIELVFVIVVIGILSAIAIPKFAATRTDAQISKGRADISSIRSGIMTERQSRLITGDSKFIKVGTDDGELDHNALFGGVLTYGIKDSATAGHWTNTGGEDDESTTTYDYQVSQTPIKFTYTRSDGIFTCSTTIGSAKSKEYCGKLIN